MLTSNTFMRFATIYLADQRISPLPPGIPNKDLAVSFNNYFIEKIAKICSDLIGKHQQLPPYIKILAPPGTHNLSNFQLITLPKLQKLVLSTPNKNCMLDPIPTALLKQILPSIVALIADIINTSLRDGMVPESFKRALVKHLLKKTSLELLEKNYRPVSNLSYISKLVEHVMAAQLVTHIEGHGMMEAHQLAYHSSHSTEAALLKVKTDIIQALDNQEVACLILLDLSAAFDTIDHDILLNRLESRFAVTGVVLKWLGSYLKDRPQAVKIDVPLPGGSRSEFAKLRSGIPQGSVLGPILFTIYTVPIGDICRKHQVAFHLYADDTQIYLSFKPSRPSSKHECIAKIEKCIEEIGIWMTQNLLKLNSNKMEFTLMGTQQQLSKLDNISLHIGSDTIKPTDHVRNLGFIMDSLLKNGSHINKITSSSYCKLCDIARIRPSLDTKTAQLIVQALVLSNIDCCNSLLAGSSQYQLDKLQ